MILALALSLFLATPPAEARVRAPAPIGFWHAALIPSPEHRFSST